MNNGCYLVVVVVVVVVYSKEEDAGFCSPSAESGRRQAPSDHVFY